jgi:hypothetical protein
MAIKRSTVFGIIGAVVAFAGAFAIAELAMAGSADPIESGLIALLVVAPLSAAVGFVLGKTLSE